MLVCERTEFASVVLVSDSGYVQHLSGTVCCIGCSAWVLLRKCKEWLSQLGTKIKATRPPANQRKGRISSCSTCSSY